MTIKAVGIKSIVNFEGNLIWVDDCIKAEPLQKALLELGQMAGSGEVSLMMRATVNGKIYQNDGDTWKEVEDFGVGYGLKTLETHKLSSYMYFSPEQIADALVIPFGGEIRTEARPALGQPTATGVFDGGVNVTTLDARPEDFTEKETKFLQKMGAFTSKSDEEKINVGSGFTMTMDELAKHLEKPLISNIQYPSGFWDPLIKSEQARPAQGPLGQCVCDSGVLFNFGCKCGFFEKGK